MCTEKVRSIAGWSGRRPDVDFDIGATETYFGELFIPFKSAFPLPDWTGDLIACDKILPGT